MLGAQVDFTGLNAPGFAISDASGNYLSAAAFQPEVFRVFPSLDGFTFSPPSALA